MAHDPEKYDTHVIWATMVASTEPEADEKINALTSKGYSPVSFCGSDHKIWGVFKLVQLIPKRQQVTTAPQEDHSNLIG